MKGPRENHYLIVDQYGRMLCAFGWTSVRSAARLHTLRQATLQVAWNNYIGNPVRAVPVRKEKVSGESSPEIKKEQFTQ